MTFQPDTNRLRPSPRRPSGRAFSPAALVALALSASTAVSAHAQTAIATPAKSAEADAALQRGDLDQAILLYNTALEDTALSNDKRAVLLVERGVALMKRRNFKPALDDFNKAATIYPEYSAVYVNRGNLLLMMGQGADATKEAIKDFERALVLAPGLAAAYGNRGAAKLKLGEVVPAVADFTRAIQLQPQNPAALNGRGQARLAFGQTTAAIRDFSRAVAINPGFAQAYRNRAAASVRLGRPADAVEDISRALAFDARRTDDYLARGDAYLAIGNAAAGLTDFAKVVELNPRSADGYIGLGYAKGLANATEDAVADLSRAIEIEPRSARAYAVRAWLYIKSQQPELGEKDVDRALRLEPVTADAYWAQGELKEAAGDRDAATGAYAHALGLDLHHRETLAALARLGLEPQRDETVIANAGADGWRVAASNTTQFTATHPQFPSLRVALEMMGDGQPKITAWERQKAPFANYGLLQYTAGALETTQGVETVECTAIVDLASMAVIGTPTAKMSGRTAAFTWSEDRLTVTGADGLSETLLLQDKRERREAAEAPSPRRSDGTSGSSPQRTNPGGTSSPRNDPPRHAAAPRKSKSLFELIFGN